MFSRNENSIFSHHAIILWKCVTENKKIELVPTAGGEAIICAAITFVFINKFPFNTIFCICNENSKKHIAIPNCLNYFYLVQILQARCSITSKTASWLYGTGGGFASLCNPSIALYVFLIGTKNWLKVDTATGRASFVGQQAMLPHVAQGMPLIKFLPVLVFIQTKHSVSFFYCVTQKGKTRWYFYFKLKEIKKSRSFLNRGETYWDDRKSECPNISENVSANAEDGCRILRVKLYH